MSGSWLLHAPRCTVFLDVADTRSSSPPPSPPVINSSSCRLARELNAGVQDLALSTKPARELIRLRRVVCVQLCTHVLGDIYIKLPSFSSLQAENTPGNTEVGAFVCSVALIQDIIK